MLQEVAYTSEPIAAFLPAIIGGVTSLVGGAMQASAERRRQKQAIQADATRLQTMRADANAAGFNPLTALHATGGGPGPAFFAPSGALGNAVARAGEFFADALSRRTQERQERSAQQAIQAQRNLSRVNQSHQSVAVSSARIFDGDGQINPVVHDYTQDIAMPQPTRPYTRTAHFEDASVMAMSPLGKPWYFTPAQAHAMAIKPGQLVTNDEISSVFGFDIGERLQRPHQLEGQMGPYGGAFDVDEPIFPHIERKFGNVTGWIGTQAEPIFGGSVDRRTRRNSR